ncbi:MAG: shikimate dehydrogenase [Anaerolineae bacterium]|nr:shikimate dehydrogenase [Thermoflexales bacterium]MDW8406173.1 shikimate dehydrogenase [Anaerolineae bacterium]
MKRVGLIGFPVAHSASPAMQRAAFIAAGLDWQYELWHTPLEELAECVWRIRADDSIVGANVTVPHKVNVMPFLDEIGPHAEAIGAVNTIVKVDSASQQAASPRPMRLIGDNTDWVGFLNDLRRHGIEIEAARQAQAAALVLGAGGSARGVVYALAHSGWSVRVANRDAGRARQLVEDMRAVFPRAELTPLPLNGNALLRAAHDVRLIVNCTSAGMDPHSDTTPWPADAPFPADAVLYDLVYKPRITRLMREAQAAGLRVIGGIGMLAEQGAAAFALWTAGMTVPLSIQEVADIMRRALDRLT